MTSATDATIRLYMSRLLSLPPMACCRLSAVARCRMMQRDAPKLYTMAYTTVRPCAERGMQLFSMARSMRPGTATAVYRNTSDPKGQQAKAACLRASRRLANVAE